MQLGRSEKILTHLNQDMKVLEIGPSYGPVVQRSEGWNVFSLDHLDAEGLRKKYAYDPNVDPAMISEVDFIWETGPLDSALPDNHRGTFDAVIASHVIEHFPDLLGFFLSAERMLRPNGILSLVVPDKRFCFDYFQSIPLTGDVLDAHAKSRSRHSRKTAFNATAYTVRSTQGISWTTTKTPTLSFAFEDGLSGAHNQYSAPVDPAATGYLDFHGWYFTPSSFRLICLELAALRLMTFTELAFFDTSGNEFFVTLTKRDCPRFDNLDECRMDYLKGIILEVREQTDHLINSGNYIGRPRPIRYEL
jgi:SAM-dependent methyltransferase